MPSAASIRSLLVRDHGVSQTGSCLRLSLSAFVPSRPCSSKLSFSGHRCPTCSCISWVHLSGSLLTAVPCHSCLAFSVEGGARSVFPRTAPWPSPRWWLPPCPMPNLALHLCPRRPLLLPNLMRTQEGVALSRYLGKNGSFPFSLCLGRIRTASDYAESHSLRADMCQTACW